MKWKLIEFSRFVIYNRWIRKV